MKVCRFEDWQMNGAYRPGFYLKKRKDFLNWEPRRSSARRVAKMLPKCASPHWFRLSERAPNVGDRHALLRLRAFLALLTFCF